MSDTNDKDLAISSRFCNANSYFEIKYISITEFLEGKCNEHFYFEI
jgi:hypothetical protein